MIKTSLLSAEKQPIVDCFCVKTEAAKNWGIGTPRIELCIGVESVGTFGLLAMSAVVKGACHGS
jgi:hypothetical protein